MEIHRRHKAFHHSCLGDEKHEMLSLNRRLETYLHRVKLLEEENSLLAKEIQSLRLSEQRALTRRKGLEQELQQARLQVDAAWRDRVHTELEVGRLADELEVLNQQGQKEAQARLKAKMMLEKSRKELEEEQRSQIWLREKVGQLEHEMKLLTQNHQEDVAHLEATMTRSRSTAPTSLAQRSNQTPDLMHLGQEFSQRATTAWQEAAETYEVQLARIEESLNQARTRLTQVNMEKSESQLKLQTLQKEVSSAQDIRLHLQKTAAQQRARQNQEIQELQHHLEKLEVEKEELGQQMNHILVENRGLMQLRISLGLEVATYRALLDSESLRGDSPQANQPGNMSNADAAFCSRGGAKDYQTQPYANYKITSPSSVYGVAERSVSATKPVRLGESPEASEKSADATTWETPYPKILQNGAVENFRAQEVYEKVTHAEPLSPPNEKEAVALATSAEREQEENQSSVRGKSSDLSYQDESSFSSESRCKDEDGGRVFTTPSPCGLSVQSNEDAAEKEELQQQCDAPADATVKKGSVSQEEEREHEGVSDSETEAVLEQIFGSRTSSLLSECEPEEGALNRPTDGSIGEKIPNNDPVSGSQAEANKAEDTLYPDGEEMDTWDSVIDRKVDVRTDEGKANDEEKRQHAEPEEDISAREPEQKTEAGQDAAQGPQEVTVASAVMDSQEDAQQPVTQDEEVAQISDKEDDEDSQNVSVSWRTEVESESYAQENTLADTRPLIQYKSDETDVNTQASHMEESESSECDQDKKPGETGTWSEGESTRFGTMEDLCEEAEGKLLDEEYDLGYTHTDPHSLTAGYLGSVTGAGNAEETVNNSDEETSEPMKSTDVGYDEALDTDRLVEQELENLCTGSYSAHFSQQHSENEKVTEERKSGQTETEESEFPCAEPTPRGDDHLPSSALIDHLYENLYFGDASATVPQPEPMDGDEIQRKDLKPADVSEKRQERGEHGVSTVTDAEDRDDWNDLIRRPETEETHSCEDPNSEQEEVLPELTRDVATDLSSESQGHLVEDEAERRPSPDAAEAAEWENLTEEVEIIDEAAGRHDVEAESDEGCHYDDKGSDEDVIKQEVESTEVSPDSVPDERDIFVVRDSTEPLAKSGEDIDLHYVFSSALKTDFWGSTTETGATCQPDDTCNDEAEQANQNLGFSEILAWGDLENTNVLNRNSRGGRESGKALDAEEEQGQGPPEVKQGPCRDTGDLVHSEESDAEGGSWSSGEEPI